MAFSLKELPQKLEKKMKASQGKSLQARLFRPRRIQIIVILSVLILILAAIIRFLTKNDSLAYGIGLVLVVATLAMYLVNSTVFEGLLPEIMKALSLFDRFTTFVNGVFDMTAIVYYCSVIAFFLFLSVQSLEKRRYN